MAATPLARRTVLAAAAIVLAVLTGLALPAMATGAPATTAAALEPPGGDKPSHDPKCRANPPCPTDRPTPTPTVGGTDPAPTPTSSEGVPLPGGSAPGPGATGPGGQPGQSGRPGQPGQPGGPGGPRPGNAPGQQPIGAVVPNGATTGPGDGSGTGSGSRAQPAGPTSLVSAARPFWPFLWGGTLLIAVVTTVLLLSLRDKPNRTAAGEPVGPGEGRDQAVPSPRGPIKIDWVERPG